MATVIAHGYEEAYLAAFRARGRELPGAAGLRRAAIESFARLGFPTTKNEAWKYTNLAPYVKTAYEAARPVPAAAVAERLRGFAFADLDCPRFVFVDGRYAPELSSGGAPVRSLRETGATPGGCAPHENNAMVALNSAFFEDGACIQIPDGKVLDAPIYLLFISTGGGTVSYPRNLIVAGRDSQAGIIEGYAGFGEGPYFTNAVTEIAVAEGSVIEHYKLQMEGEQALHYGMLAVEQGASSSFSSHNIALGSAMARNEISGALAGEGAECTLNGLYLAGGRQHIDNHTTLDHARPHTTSREMYKGILDGKSEGVFHGRIIVRPEAQKTDAIQRNKNLLLSKDAVINTKPQLEIYADDVRCTHGATVGQVDQESVFYLRSRGIALEEARRLLTYAFTSEILEGMKAKAVRARLGEALFGRFGG
jgi:Fe-S cluster assembly protein SufD